MAEPIWAYMSYLDASAIVKVVVDEPQAQRVQRYLTATARAVPHVTPLCFTEALGVLKRKWKRNEQKEFDHDEYLWACEELVDLLHRKTIYLDTFDAFSNTAFRAAIDLARKYKLDVCDALQIVTIKEGFARHATGPSKTLLVTADEGLEEAARGEGVLVWNLLKSNAPPEE